MIKVNYSGFSDKSARWMRTFDKCIRRQIDRVLTGCKSQIKGIVIHSGEMRGMRLDVTAISV